MSNFRSRLGAKLDRISTKLIDNRLRLAGSLTDFIRYRIVKDKFGDELSRKVESYEVIDVVAPQIKEIPLRRLENYYTGAITKININPTEENQTPYQTIFIPLKYDVWQDDLLVKVYDAGGLYLTKEKTNDIYLLALQVKEVLGDFGERMILFRRYKCTIFDDVLPEGLVLKLKEMRDRRQNW